jgi:hypothetical protein
MLVIGRGVFYVSYTSLLLLTVYIMFVSMSMKIKGLTEMVVSLPFEHPNLLKFVVAFIVLPTIGLFIGFIYEKYVMAPKEVRQVQQQDRSEPARLRRSERIRAMGMANPGRF